MYRNVLLLVLVALARCAEIPRKNVEPRDIFSDADALLRRLTDTVMDEIQESLPVLSLLPNQMQALGKAVLVPAEVEIQVIYDHLVHSVNQIQQKAQDDGQTIGNCITTYQYELDILPRYIVNEISACIDASVKSGSDIIRRSIEEIRATENLVFRLALQLQECKIIGEASCVEPILERIEIDLIELPARIREDTTITRNVVRALSSDLHFCSSDKVDIVQTIGVEIINYIEQCIEDNNAKLIHVKSSYRTEWFVNPPTAENRLMTREAAVPASSSSSSTTTATSTETSTSESTSTTPTTTTTTRTVITKTTTTTTTTRTIG